MVKLRNREHTNSRRLTHSKRVRAESRRASMWETHSRAKSTKLSAHATMTLLSLNLIKYERIESIFVFELLTLYNTQNFSAC